MKQQAIVAGAGMTRFGNHRDTGLKALAGEAIQAALADAGIDARQLQAAYMGNVAASVITGQVCVPGQMALRELGVGRIPVVNVENACATASTAFEQACSMITLGRYDIVLACGYEKLYHEDKQRTFSAFTGAVDIENMDAVLADITERVQAAGIEADLEGAGKTRSLFMDIYVAWAVEHMKRYGTTREQFAAVSAKNSFHGSLNARAQYREELTVEDVLGAREIAWPLTLPMCSPVGDGAAAVVLVSERKARELGLGDKAVRVASSVLASGWDYTAEDDVELPEVVARQAYEEAGVGPEDLSCVELHDASAPSELIYYEHLGLCEKGDGGALIESGATRLGGRVPVNTSGGLLRKGHPIGATGIAQIVELTEQLRGTAGDRQVEGARVALAENGGGYIGRDAAALVVSILTR
ncbi:thiolase family protein [Algiphilus aromaticivorans]|uniref:thiolase family protein n=1 Tax=Algiphilus aromaticivorans TaxID=382454 RepID=UPI0005C15768|nr:thiolase family protein [Algiphilus aromaticivorans]